MYPKHRMTLKALRADLQQLPPDTAAHEGSGHCVFDMYLERQGVVEPQVFTHSYTYFDPEEEAVKRVDTTKRVAGFIGLVDDTFDETEDEYFTAEEVLELLAKVLKND